MTQHTTAPSRTSHTSRVEKVRPRLSHGTVRLIQATFLLLIALISLVPVLAIFVGTFQDGNDVIQVLGTLLVSSFVAYGFAMYEFRGKSLGFILVIILMTIPFEMLMLPLYVQVNDIGAADQYWVVVLPFLAQAVTIFFFRQYFLGVPKEILEAGRVDGVSEFGIFFRLVVPIAKPAFAAMAILNGMTIWNNFLWPLLVLRSPDKFLLPIGLNTLLTPYGNNYELLIIGSFFSLIPILILFFAFQRFFVSGMTAGAVKG